MERIIKLFFTNQGYLILGLYLTSVLLAVLGLIGYEHEALFFSAWALTLTLPIFLFWYSALYRSPLITLASISMFIFMSIMLVDRLRGGGYWLPVMDGELLCYSSLIYSLVGAAIFCFTDWRHTKRLSVARKISLVVMALTYPIACAIYLCGAPLVVSFLILFFGFGYLLFAFRVMLFGNIFRRKGIILSIYDDINTH